MQLPLPIWRVQYLMLGGHRRLAAIGMAIVGVMIAGFMVGRRIFADSTFPQLVDGWIIFLTFVQILVLILAGTNAIYRAVLRDFDSKMLESHRLTPLSNVTVIAGYLFGATIQSVAIAVLIMLFGIALLLMAQQPVQQWLMGHVVVLSVALMLWSAVTFFCLYGSKPRAPGGYLVVIGMVTQFVVIVPGAGVALGIYSVFAGFGALTGNRPLAPPELAALVVGNLILAAFWFYAAAAKFRRPELPAFHALRGSLFYIGWMVLAVGAFVAVMENQPAFLRSVMVDDPRRLAWIATLCTSVFMAFFPIAGAVHSYWAVRGGHRPRAWFDRVAPYRVVLVCAVWFAVALVHVDRIEGTWALLAAAALVAMLTTMIVFELALRLARNPLLISGAALLVLWAVPCLIDTARASMAGFDATPQLGWLFGASPFGTIIAANARLGINLVPGLVAQGLVIVLAVAVLVAVRRRSGRHNN